MWLVGMMGSGKTTIGQQAATAVGVPFYDTDQLVEEMARTSISAIWDGVGEEGFRELERRAISTVPDQGFIAAAGGGAVLDEGNRDHMRRGAPIVWLRCDPDTLAKRLSGADDRPLLDGDLSPRERLAAVLGERVAVYSAVANDVIDTDDLDVAGVVSEVVGIWER